MRTGEQDLFVSVLFFRRHLEGRSRGRVDVTRSASARQERGVVYRDRCVVVDRDEKTSAGGEANDTSGSMRTLRLLVVECAGRKGGGFSMFVVFVSSGVVSSSSGADVEHVAGGVCRVKVRGRIEGEG